MAHKLIPWKAWTWLHGQCWSGSLRHSATRTFSIDTRSHSCTARPMDISDVVSLPAECSIEHETAVSLLLADDAADVGEDVEFICGEFPMPWTAIAQPRGSCPSDLSVVAASV